MVTFTIFDYLARRNIKTFSIVLFLGRQMYSKPYLYDVFVIHVSLPVVLDTDTEYHRRGVESIIGVPLLSLDTITWKSGWGQTPPDEFQPWEDLLWTNTMRVDGSQMENI